MGSAISYTKCSQVAQKSVETPRSSKAPSLCTAVLCAAVLCASRLRTLISLGWILSGEGEPVEIDCTLQPTRGGGDPVYWLDRKRETFQLVVSLVFKCHPPQGCTEAFSLFLSSCLFSWKEEMILGGRQQQFLELKQGSLTQAASVISDHFLLLLAHNIK